MRWNKWLYPEDVPILRIASWLWLLGRVKARYSVYTSLSLKLNAGKNIVIEKRCILTGDIILNDDIVIEKECVLKGKIHIASDLGKRNVLIGDIKIGKYCALADDIKFYGVNHDTSKATMQMKLYKEVTGFDLEMIAEPIIVGSDVWIGTNTIILPGVKVGNGAVIGAGSIVTKDVKPYEVVAGNPAKHIKWRFNKSVRKKLLKLQWWKLEKADERLRGLFVFDLTKFKFKDKK